MAIRTIVPLINHQITEVSVSLLWPFKMKIPINHQAVTMPTKITRSEIIVIYVGSNRPSPRKYKLDGNPANMYSKVKGKQRNNACIDNIALLAFSFMALTQS